MSQPMIVIPGMRSPIFDAGGSRLAGIMQDNSAQVADAEMGKYGNQRSSLPVSPLISYGVYPQKLRKSFFDKI